MKQKKNYVGLSDAERSEISILKTRDCSIREIAKALGRSPNTVSYELKQNSVNGKYDPMKAKAKSRVARRSRRFQWQKIESSPKLRAFIIEKLAPPYDWSPNEIAGYLKTNPELGFIISNRQLYAWLYSARGQPYCQYLYSERYHKKRRTKKTERVMIPGRIAIQERPTAAQDRAQAGHYEYDSVVSSKRSKSTYALAVLVERTTRLVSARVVPNLRPEPFARSIIGQLGSKMALSFTTDNGIENKQHSLITKATGAIVYFTDPYSSYQKGGVENANKMLRRYFPKGTDFSQISQAMVDRAVARINQKPRQILGFTSALQLSIEKGII
jgi:IS30 family transposase